MTVLNSSVVQHGLVHISAGDLLRAQVEAGTEAGRKAKQYMDEGHLVPNEVVVDMVVNRLQQEDAQSKGWLLDGYPRSGEQAEAIEAAGIHPDAFILINVSALCMGTCACHLPLKALQASRASIRPSIVPSLLAQRKQA